MNEQELELFTKLLDLANDEIDSKRLTRCQVLGLLDSFTFDGPMTYEVNEDIFNQKVADFLHEFHLSNATGFGVIYEVQQSISAGAGWEA